MDGYCNQCGAPIRPKAVVDPFARTKTVTTYDASLGDWIKREEFVLLNGTYVSQDDPVWNPRYLQRTDAETPPPFEI